MLAKVVSDHQTDWDTHLPQVLFAYRTSIHDTTGFTPFHITFGRSPILPIDTMIGIPPLQRKVTDTVYCFCFTVKKFRCFRGSLCERKFFREYCYQECLR